MSPSMSEKTIGILTGIAFMGIIYFLHKRSESETTLSPTVYNSPRRKSRALSDACHSGSCHCGKIAFEVVAELELNAVEISSKIKFPRLSILKDNFKFLSDELDLSIYSVDQGEGDLGVFAFCSHCGVHILFSPSVNEPTEVQINADCLNPATINKLNIGYLSVRETTPCFLDKPYNQKPLLRQGRGSRMGSFDMTSNESVYSFDSPLHQQQMPVLSSIQENHSLTYSFNGPPPGLYSAGMRRGSVHSDITEDSVLLRGGQQHGSGNKFAPGSSHNGEEEDLLVYPLLDAMGEMGDSGKTDSLFSTPPKQVPVKQPVMQQAQQQQQQQVVHKSTIRYNNQTSVIDTPVGLKQLQLFLGHHLPPR